MSIRTLALAAALTLGVSSAAVAQGVIIDTPLGGVGVGVGPGPYVYGDGPVYGDGYYHDRAPYGGWSVRGDRADEDIFTGSGGSWEAQDDYEDQTGINNN